MKEKKRRISLLFKIFVVTLRLTFVKSASVDKRQLNYIFYKHEQVFNSFVGGSFWLLIDCYRARHHKR